MPSKPGFRLGIYMCKDLEIVDFAAPYGVFSVARRLDPELDAFFVAEALRPVQAQAGFTIMPNYAFADEPDMDAFLIAGGFGTRQELNNGRLHAFIRALPDKTLLVSVCTGSWIYGRMGLLDGRMATNRKEPDRLESSRMGKVPIDRLAEIARPAASAGREWWIAAASLPGGASRRAWRSASICSAARAMGRTSSPRWPASWNTRRPMKSIAAISPMIKAPRNTKSSQHRHLGRAVTPYPGSQKALAFVTIPDNAVGVSGMTGRSNQPASSVSPRLEQGQEAFANKPFVAAHQLFPEAVSHVKNVDRLLAKGGDMSRCNIEFQIAETARQIEQKAGAVKSVSLDHGQFLRGRVINDDVRGYAKGAEPRFLQTAGDFKRVDGSLSGKYRADRVRDFLRPFDLFAVGKKPLQEERIQGQTSRVVEI